MAAEQSLLAFLKEPAPDTLWQLRGELLASSVDPNAPIMTLITACYNYLNNIIAGTSARAYSNLASLLDVGAVGGVALQNLLTDTENDKSFWQRLLTGGVSESLMVAASRQYVKADETAVNATIRDAAWFLFEEWWQLSLLTQPDLSHGQRRDHIDKLLAPALDNNFKFAPRALLVGRLFQTALLGRWLQLQL
jgi:hypothetical protein